MSDGLQRKVGISGDHVHHLYKIRFFQMAKKVGMRNSVAAYKKPHKKRTVLDFPTVLSSY